MRGLYAIVDHDRLRRLQLDPLRFAEAVCSARPAALQLRAKSLGARASLTLLQALRLIAEAAAVPLFANDRADLAALAGCAGLHVGQDDVPPSLARRMFSSRSIPIKIGMSVHNAAELAVALAEEPDYLAFGPVFTTRSKDNPDPSLGLDGLEELVAAAQPSGLPCVAIGGIDHSNASAVAQRCPSAAVIGGLLPASDAVDPYAEIAERAGELQQLLTGASPGATR